MKYTIVKILKIKFHGYWLFKIHEIYKKVSLHDIRSTTILGMYPLYSM